ncbi:MAG: endonuclease III [Myxococcaceae bacterium]|nr:endonuclease III [Myxococcaceae bacterium]
MHILDILSACYSDAQIELCFDKSDPWQLLVAVVLSAQTTDKAVNKVTPTLFEAYPNVQAMAGANIEEVAMHIRTLGFFKTKATHLVRGAQKIVEDFAGQVPAVREDLERIPGVGPKSAAVILANAYGQDYIAVDTHVGRIARRLGFSKHSDPSKVEQDLNRLLPQSRRLEAHHVFIFHGRRTCFARKPNCVSCPIHALCPAYSRNPASQLE